MSALVFGEIGKDPTLPDVSVVLGGEAYRLCYDMGAIKQMKDLTGVNLLEAAINPTDPGHVSAMLFSGMVRDSPGITLEKVDSLVNLKNLAYVYGAVQAAWAGSIEDPEGDDSQGEVPAPENA